MAGGGAHDGDHLARLHGGRRGRRHMGVDVADADRDALGQPRPRGGLGAQPSGPRPQLADGVLQLVGDEAGEVRVQRREVLGSGVDAVLELALVTGGAGVAQVGAAQLPHDPVRGLDPALGAAVDLRVLLQHLQRLGELPLRGDLAAVPLDPRLLALGGECRDPVGVGLGGVVLPQFDVGVRAAGVLGEFAQGGAVGEHREDRAGREVRADADHLLRPHARLRERLGHGVAQHVDVVGGHLQGPVGRQRGTVGQLPVEDGVRVRVLRRAQLRAVPDPYHHGPPGQRAVVDSHDAGFGVLLPIVLGAHPPPPFQCSKYRPLFEITALSWPGRRSSSMAVRPQKEARPAKTREPPRTRGPAGVPREGFGALPASERPLPPLSPPLSPPVCSGSAPGRRATTPPGLIPTSSAASSRPPSGPPCRLRSLSSGSPPGLRAVSARSAPRLRTVEQRADGRRM